MREIAKKFLNLGVSILLLVVLIGIALFTKEQVTIKQNQKIKIVKAVSSIKQINLWMLDFSDQKKRRPNSIEELLEFARDSYGDTAKVEISNLKTGKLIYDRNADFGEEMLRWEIHNVIIVATPEGGVRQFGP